MITVEVYDDPNIVMNYCLFDDQRAANFPFNFQLIDRRFIFIAYFYLNKLISLCSH